MEFVIDPKLVVFGLLNELLEKDLLIDRLSVVESSLYFFVEVIPLLLTLLPGFSLFPFELAVDELSVFGDVEADLLCFVEIDFL